MPHKTGQPAGWPACHRAGVVRFTHSSNPDGQRRQARAHHQSLPWHGARQCRFLLPPLLPNGRASCVMQQCGMKAYVASEYAAERPVLLHALLTINSVSCSGGMLIKAVPAFGIVLQLWCGGGCFRHGASRCWLRQAGCGKPELSKAGHGWPAAATKQGQSRRVPFWPCFVGLRR